MTTIACDIRPLWEKNWGGVSWYCYHLVQGLVKSAAANQCRLILFYNKWKLFDSPIVPLLKEWRGSPNVRIRGYRMPNKLLNLSMRFLKFPYIDELVKADYFILPNLNFIALTPKTKVIVVCHDLSQEIFPEFFTPRQRLWHWLINPRALYARADQLIAISHNTKEDLVDLYDIAKDKIKVIYPGIDHENFQPDAPTAVVRDKYQLNPGYLLSVGTLEPRKNLETLIEAYDLLASTRPAVPALVIAGAEGWKYDRIYRFWLRAAHKSQIRFLGPVPAADLPALYAAARCLIYPSFYEGFGLPPVECMACATPVIVGHGSSLPEVVGDAGLLIDPFDIADVARAMALLLSDQELYDKLKSKGLVRAKEYNWENMVKQITVLVNIKI